MRIGAGSASAARQRPLVALPGLGVVPALVVERPQRRGELGGLDRPAVKQGAQRLGEVLVVELDALDPGHLVASGERSAGPLAHAVVVGGVALHGPRQLARGLELGERVASQRREHAITGQRRALHRLDQ